LAVSDIGLDLAPKVAAAAGGPPRGEALMLDATKGAEANELVHSLLARHGAIDGLINAAGGMRGLGIPKADFADLTPEAWTRILGVNFHSVLHCTHAVLPAMIAAKRGAIVSIAASRGLHGGPQASIYSAAKAAIIVFSQSLAQEVGGHDLRVNSIAPGNAEVRRKKHEPVRTQSAWPRDDRR
jgi:NAD(P)-dependent dehydrogenase (short-subunit alcohol dehydrogenase family)